MDYKFSNVVPRDAYVTDGLSFDVPLRIHEEAYSE